MPRKALKPKKPTTTNAALKAEYVAWLLSSDPEKPRRYQWAKEKGLDEKTLWRWQTDPYVQELLQAAEIEVMPKGFVLVLKNMYDAATSSDDLTKVSAATFLARVFGKFKPEKVEGKLTLMDWLAEQAKEK